MSKLFLGVRGQDKAISVLSKQLESKNLSHAYLFLGKEGSGKEHLARVFSQYILCGNKKDDDCEGCKRFKKDLHPDFMFINGSNGIKIDDIRKAVERINLSPNLSKRKVLLITDVENMNIEAANALLKTLEEPPTDSVIILSAITKKSLPETIVSRTQSIKLRVLSTSDIKKVLSKEFGDSNLDKVIELSSGSINKAKEMLIDTEVMEKFEKIKNDVDSVRNSESIIEKFKIIESYDKEKKIKEFFDVYAKSIFTSIANNIKEGGSSTDSKIGKEILKVYENLNYNVSLRISLEKIVLKEHLNV